MGAEGLGRGGSRWALGWVLGAWNDRGPAGSRRHLYTAPRIPHRSSRWLCARSHPFRSWLQSRRHPSGGWQSDSSDDFKLDTSCLLAYLCPIQMAKRRFIQLELKPRTHGGARAGAGRKPTGRGGVRHRRRPEHDSRHPVHVTLRVSKGVPTLRTKGAYRVARAALEAGSLKDGFRVVHYSVLRDHLHLIVEAADKRRLSRGMQGLKIRLARRLNRFFNRTGALFADRYHARALRTPREVKAALGYVLHNAKKHAKQGGRRIRADWLDPFSTADLFFEADRGLRRARTWLLSTGWRRWGDLPRAWVPG